MQEGKYIENLGTWRQTESEREREAESSTPEREREREREAESSTPGFAGKGGGRGWVEKGGCVRRSETRSGVESTCRVNSATFSLSSSTFL